MAFSRGGGTLPVVDLDGERIVDSDADHRRARDATAGARPLSVRSRRAPPGAGDRGVLRRGGRPRHAPGRLLGGAQGAGVHGSHFMATDQPVPRRGCGSGPCSRSSGSTWCGATASTRSRSSAARLPWSARSTGSSRSAHGRDHLVGDGFTVADLTAAALLYPLVWPPEFQYELPEPPDGSSWNRWRATPRSTGSRRPGGAIEAISAAV